MKHQNKKHRCVWIELERHSEDEANELSALKGTQLLRRLGIEHDSFKWNSERGQYEYLMGPDGNHGYYDLPQDGHMFNLDYLAG